MSRKPRASQAKPVAQMSAKEVADAAQAWDAAKAQLKTVADLAAAAQAALEALPADASEEDRQRASQAVEQAKAAVVEAQAAIAKLTPPDLQASAAGSETEKSTNTTPPKGEGSGEAGTMGGLPTDFDFVGAYEDACAAFARKVSDLREAEGDQAALAYIGAERAVLETIAGQMAAFKQEMDALYWEIAPGSADADRVEIVVTGPKGGRWRAGHHFGVTKATVAVTLEELEQIDADPALSWVPDGEEA